MKLKDFSFEFAARTTLVLLILATFVSCGSTGPSAEELRLEKLGELLMQVKSLLFLASIFFVLGTLFGPGIMEWIRARVASHFRLSQGTQIQIAGWSYGLLVASIVLATVMIDELNQIWMAVAVLFLGTLLPFFTEVLPGIERENPEQRKSGASKIKSMLFLIAVFYIILTLLSPEGFGPLEINPRI